MLRYNTEYMRGSCFKACEDNWERVTSCEFRRSPYKGEHLYQKRAEKSVVCTFPEGVSLCCWKQGLLQESTLCHHRRGPELMLTNNYRGNELILIPSHSRVNKIPDSGTSD